MSNAFPKSFRLLNSVEFKQVFNNSRRLAVQNIALFSCPNRLDHPRLGLSISKKNVRSAVARNTIKRIMRESFRAWQHQLDSLDIVIVVYRGVDRLTKTELFECLERLWQKLLGQQ